jgi:hypothetical protein
LLHANECNGSPFIVESTKIGLMMNETGFNKKIDRLNTTKKVGGQVKVATIKEGGSEKLIDSIKIQMQL